MKHESIYVVYDLETGGFGARKNGITQGSFTAIDTYLNKIDKYENFIKPYGRKDTNDPYQQEYIKASGNAEGITYTKGALDYTKTTIERLVDEGIDLKQFYKDLCAFFKKYNKGAGKKVTLVGHNSAEFDNEWLEFIFEMFGDNLYKHVGKVHFDTMGLSRLTWGHVDVENHKLGGVAARMGVELTDAHEAGNDTEATADIFIKFVKKLRSEGGEQTIAEPKEEARTFQF